MLGTRAVLRVIEGGLEAWCPPQGGCGAEVKFQARIPSGSRRCVVANVYWLGKWNRVETWHLPCYVRAGMPHGRPLELKDEDLETLLRVLATYDNPWDVNPFQLIDDVVEVHRHAV